MLEPELRLAPSVTVFRKKAPINDPPPPPAKLCPTNDGVEDAGHFLLLCPSFDDQRRDILARIEELLRLFVQIANHSNDALTQLLLYGDKDLSREVNRDILKLTVRFIRETGRFD